MAGEGFVRSHASNLIAGIGVFALIAPSAPAQSSALWTNRFHLGDDFGLAVAVDSSGDVVVGGTVSTAAVNSDNFATIKYSSAGTPLWTNFYNGPGNNVDSVTTVAVDGGGNAFVTGTSKSTAANNSEDYATIKYSIAGVPVWTNRYDGPGGDFDSVTAMVVDGQSNVIVTGFSRRTINFYSEDYATIKYSAAGTELWVRRLNGTGIALTFPTPSRWIKAETCL